METDKPPFWESQPYTPVRTVCRHTHSKATKSLFSPRAMSCERCSCNVNVNLRPVCLPSLQRYNALHLKATHFFFPGYRKRLKALAHAMASLVQSVVCSQTQKEEKNPLFQSRGCNEVAITRPRHNHTPGPYPATKQRVRLFSHFNHQMPQQARHYTSQPVCTQCGISPPSLPCFPVGVL